MTEPIVAVTIGRSNYARMFSEQAWDRLESFATVVHHDGDEPAGKEDLLGLLSTAQGCITSWGVAQIDADVMAAAASLEAVAHMGSSVKRFVSDAVWDRGVRVTSAGIALARDVAETTLGLMIVGRKRIWPLGRHVSDGGWRDSPVWKTWDARELTLGTPAPQSIAPTDIDCTELYHRRIALMRRQVDYGPTDYFSDPRVGASLFIGAVWTPGFYYLPFHALQRFQKEQHRPQQQADIDALRTASAAQRCFEH